MTSDPVLLFVSTRFLFPADSGGKIRTIQILRGLKGGRFRVRLLMPGDAEERKAFESDLDSICDEVVLWAPEPKNRVWRSLSRFAAIASSDPISVAADKSDLASRVISQELADQIAVVVFDFPHSEVLAPAEFEAPAVMFTHNIEAEIYKRHFEIAKTFVRRRLWRNQYQKMVRFEQKALKRFDTVIAVSKRDCDFFRSSYGIKTCNVISTGVDIEYFEFSPPGGRQEIVFCGSMDWLANVDGIEWFFSDVWPHIIRNIPDVRMKVVGRAPPESLVARITALSPEWTFTGFVDDIRPYISGADAFVIPLRVGGGTRIKAFEAMAIGTPVVSTPIGIEGLDLHDGLHFLEAETAISFAGAVVSLLRDHSMGKTLAYRARKYVEENFSDRRSAREFERICISTAGLRENSSSDI